MRNPVPGDEIIGFITGVTVCPSTSGTGVNVPRDISQAEEPARWVRVHWEDSVKEEFKATLHIDAVDRQALLADITTQLASMHVMIHAINAREPQDGYASMSLTVGVNGLDHLQSVINRLLKIPGVEQVDRSRV